MVLPTQPQRGISPGGMPGPPMQGQGRGPNVGMPKAQTPIPSSVPGVNNVGGEPNPDDIVDLFNAYTSGQLSREQLINQLDVFSEGRGGILGLLESMESPQEGVEGGGMPGAPPNPMGGESPAGAIPPLEGKLDKRHLLISAKLQDYGITAEDADQMATVLNPNEAGVPYAWEQKQISLTFGEGRDSIGIGTGDVTKQGAFNAARASIAPKLQALSDDQIWEAINAQAPNAAMTSADIKVDYTPRSKVPVEFGGMLGYQDNPIGLDIDDEPEWRGNAPEQAVIPDVNVQSGIVWDEETGQYVDSKTFMPTTETQTSSTTAIPSPTAVPKETGQLVWDEETGQMVDSGTWLPPKAGRGLTAAQLAEKQRQEEQRKLELQRGGAYGDMGEVATSQEMLRQGGAYGDMSAAADTIRATPAINGGAYGDMSQASTNRAIEAGGGAYGDMSTAADTVNRRNFPNAAGDMGQARTDPGLEARYQDGPTVNVDGKTISLEVYEQFKKERGQQAEMSGFWGWWETAAKDAYGNLTELWPDIKEGYPVGQGGKIPGLGEGPNVKDPDLSRRTGKGTREDPFKYPDDPQRGEFPVGVTPSGQPPTPQVRDAAGNIVIQTGDETTGVAEDPLFGPGVGAITGRKEGDPIDIFGQAPSGYTGETLIQPGAEGGDPYPSSTEPGMTGFKTVDDFAFPELKTFLNALSDEARSGMGSENLPGQIIDALTQLSQQRMTGNAQLAQSNTQAAIAFLDRAAVVSRDAARLELEEKQMDINKGLSIAEMTGKYGDTDKLTLAGKTEEYRRIMEQFLATGKVPQIDASGNLVSRIEHQMVNRFLDKYPEGHPKEGQPAWSDDGKTLGRTFNVPSGDMDVVQSAGETFEREKTYAELAQQKQISMTETFGKLLNFDRFGKMIPTGVDEGATMETLEAQAFGFTKLIQKGEQAGRLMEMDAATGEMRVMTDPNLITDDNPEGVVDTLEARRFAWERDVNVAREKWMQTQLENDITTAELEAATQQYTDQLTNLVESGKLAEAIAARKEKGASARRLEEHKKNELRVNTLLTLAKPETMLFVQRYNLLDDLGAALGIDFSVEQIPQPEPMVEPGTYPTMKMLQMATPGERQIMMAETAAWGGAAIDNASAESAMERVRDWTPGSKPLQRGLVKTAVR